MLADIKGLSKHFTEDSLRAYLAERSTRGDGGCLIIRGYGSRSGVHQKVAGRAWAHIAAYVVFVGGYDPDLDVAQSCGVKDCIEPTHLRQATRTETSRARRQRPVCRQGHPRELDDATGRYRRGCRVCNRDAQRRWRERQAEEVARARTGLRPSGT
ncbi:HNH endonuclease [Planosporangium mesophilum]|uniref:HNH endonuclease n=1 Tax=Planosporangium mesophilum TaxID=689768 RepID=A0A8J3TBR8_9ACTN|nr:HNH endonuclease [Planosporangium mesophilum]NJC83015.1 HNH endonuclease [Planosporangium mesophilum]GII22421.1 hypothetical protein Pme01_20180 [Planosporangium mesophilum]